MISLLFIWLNILSMHPFHVSVCDVVVNSEARAVQISQRIFVDDLEQTLTKKSGITLFIDENSTQKELDSLVELYLKDRLVIRIDGKATETQYLGHEFEEDGIWCYLEIEGIKKVKSVEVISTVLLDEFDDQANIIHFSSGEYEKSVKLDEQDQGVIFTPPRQ